MKQIIINGYIRCKKYEESDYYQEIEIERENSLYKTENLAKLIAEQIEETNYKYEPSNKQEVDSFEDGLEDSKNIKDVFMRIYYSNKKKPLEEIQENHLKKLLGDLDIYIEWDGYSEFTILDYDTKNFMIGNHNLKEIFLQYIDKYVYIIIDLK